VTKFLHVLWIRILNPDPDPGGQGVKASAVNNNKKFLNCFLFLWAILRLLDLDPDSEYGSTDLTESGSNHDPDPDPDLQHCVNVSLDSNKPKI
jgi:hypothetical protein